MTNKKAAKPAAKAAALPAPGPAPSFRAATLSHRKPTRFRWAADEETRTALASDLGLQGIAALALSGEFLPEGRADFRLVAEMHAEVTQSCVITLAPVPAVIDEAVLRHYQADWQEPEAEEYEVLEDDSREALPEVISLQDVVAEALSLALPPYPRAEGAELGETIHAEAGTEALRDEDLRPFAGLAQLMKKSQEGGEADG